MILTNRLFERGQPNREAKSIYIFCEGAKREYSYFRYFREIDSRINIEVYQLHPHDDNSPLGLLKIARNCIIVSESNPHPQYAFQTNDEVWIVLDTDLDKYESRKTQIEEIKRECDAQSGWFIAQSNPCFEVWLYYHLHQDIPQLERKGQCKSWKKLVNDSIGGGFDSRRHPLFLQEAAANAEANFSMHENKNPTPGATEVFKLAKSMLPLIGSKIKEVKAKITSQAK